MNRLLQITWLLTISLAYANQAEGQCTNPSIPLPDASTPVNGNPATAYCVTLTFNPAQTGYPTGVSMLLQHTFQGDLDVFINACGNTLNIMQRPGAIGNCAGGSPFGNPNDIGSPGNPSLVTFADGGGPDPENGIALGGGTYGITSDDACGVGTPGINSFASLWAACPPGNISAQICIGDHAFLDSGVAQNITLNFPSPIICGCTNPLAPNYNPSANVDDGSCLPCVFTVTATPTQPSCALNNGSISLSPSGAGYTYAWSPGSVSGANPTNLAPGSYSVTVTQTSTGCTGTASVTLNSSTTLTVSASATQPTCGQNNGSISVTPSGAGYTYAWNPGSVSGANPTNLAPGTYSVTVTQTAGGCTGTASVTLSPSPPILTSATPTQPTCGQNNGSISVNPSGAGYTYTWNPPSVSGSNPTNLPPGAYSVTVTQTASGCTATASTTLNPSPTLNVTMTPTQPSCGLNNGVISVSPAGAGYTYAWNPGTLFGSSAVNLGPGSYSVTVTETATGCMAGASVTLNPSSPMVATATPTQPTCAFNNGSISVTPAGPGYTYVWNPPVVGGANPNNLAPGSYTVTVTETATGCMDDVSVTLNPSAPLTVSLNVAQTSCGQNNGGIIVSPAGAGYTYAWTPPSLSGPSALNLAPGTYSVTVTQLDGGCTDDASATINPSSPPMANITAGPGTICVGQSSTLTATGGGTYTWSTGQTGASITVSPASTTSYTVTVTNAGCAATANITVTVNTVTASASASPTSICAGQAGTLTATGGGTYAWSTGQTGASITVNPTTTTTYTVTVTNNGCTDEADVTVNINTVTATATASPTTICAGQAGTLTAGGGGTYAWSTGQSGSPITVNPTATTTYTVTVTNNGCTDVATVTVTINTVTASASADPTTICAGQAGTLTATGGGTYAWSTGQSGAAITVNPTATTTYTVTVTNNGCTDVATVTVMVNTVTASVMASPTTICAGQASTLTASGGGTYSWSTGETGASIIVSPTTSTAYTVTVTNNGCTDDAIINVVVNTVNASIMASPTTICAGQAGTLTAGGGGTYAWSTGQTGSTISISPASTTTYTVTVTNNGCTDVASLTVTVNSVTATASAAPSVICEGGASVLTATGGGTYIWSTGQTGAGIAVSPSTSSTYSVTVTNNGCTDIANVTVNVTVVNAQATASPTAICEGATSTLTATGGGTYAWSTGQSGASITVAPTATTTYSVTVTNNGCTDVANVTVTVNSVTATATANPATVCAGQVSMLTATGGGTYLWSTGQTGATIPVVAGSTTTFSVTVTNNGCTDVATVTVNVNSVTATASASPTTICAGQASTLSATGGGTYVWSTGQSGSPITVNPTATTTYTVTVTNGGCSGIANVTVNVNIVTAQASASPTAICEGETSTLTATGGGTYAWSTGQIGASITVAPTATTTYTVTVTNNGCTDEVDVTVTVNTVTATATANPTTICAGNPVQLTATGGGTYQWSSGQTTATFSVAIGTTTTFSVTVTDSNGCTDEASVTVNVISTVASVSASPSTVCPGLSSVLTATGGGTYQWSTGETGATITVTPGATTTYSVTVTNNGCVDVEQVTVTVGAILTPTVTASPTTVCPGQSSVLTASGGDTYSWSTGQSGASITVSPITTTTYSVTATNNGCTGTATVPVNVDPSLTATATAGPMTICEGQSSTLSATGGGTYAWSTGQSGSPIMVSPSGTTTYTVTVTNNGCTGTADVTVNVTPPPSATATANPPTICAGQAGTLTATGGGTYLWSDGQIGASVTVMPSSTTSYTVTVTNNGCTATATVTVNVNPLPTPTASASPAVICAGQAGTLTATGGGTYQWNTGQTGATINVSPTSTTTYTVTVTNNGCTATADVTMTVNPLPTPTASASPAVICAGQAGTLTATGGGTYQWNTGQTGATINVSPTATTTYTVTVTNNGCTATTDVTVTVNPLPMPTASASPTTICAGQSSTLTATGGGTYQWNGGQFGSPIQVSPASTTTYTVTVTNNGCTGTADVTVTVNSTTATATASPAAICAGLASTLTATGGGTYAWSTGQSGASISVNPTVTTTYSVTVTNNGCTDEATVSVNVENNLSATATASPAAICAGQASTLTATGGGTYAWSSGQSGATITVSPVATTTYTVTVTNNGCTGTASVTVTVNPLPTPMAVASPAVICAGQAGTLTATGGGAYTWSTGQSGASITVSPTATTTYSVTATNNGCSGETQVTVTVNTTTATATAALSTVCPGLSTTLTATGGGTYAWSTGQSGATITVTPAATTTYTVTVTNNGCTDVASATVAVSNVLVPSIEASPASICTGQSTVLTAFGGDTFLWNTGQTDPSITVMPSVTTTYSVEVGLNGCTGSSSITVVVNPLPVPTASANPSSICAGQAATLTASGGDTFQWSTGESGSSISVTPAATTTYSVTATSNGCTGTTDVTVVVNPLPVAAAFAAPDSICAGQAGTLTATGGSTYMWSTGQSGSSIVVTPASTTTYTVTVTDSGCNATTDVTVTVNPLPTPTATANPGSLCAGQAGTLTATGGDTYLWSDGQSGASVEVTPTATTTYAVTVTSIYGCQAATSTTVTVNPLPTATASPETICLGQSAVLTAGGGTTYSWSTGQTGASITVSPTATTIYTVTVTANGCTDTTNVTVTVNEVNASVSASATTICPGLPVDLIASGGSVYSWSTGQAGETITVNPVVNTTYSVTVTNQGCTGLASVTVMMGDTLTPTIIATPDTLCAGQAGTLTAEGGGTYQWSSGQSSASIIVAPTSTTTYVVTVANSGCVGAAQTTIVVNPLPVPDVQTSAPVICDGDSATLSASGGSAYLWSTGDTDAVISVSPSQTTLYSVTVTENGCSATASTTLIVNPIPVALAQPDTICVGQSAALSASGGDVYQWSTGQSGASITVSPVVTTTYSVTVIDEGCTSVIPVTVTVNPLPEPVAVASPPIICFGQSTTLTVSGGATFVWSTGQSGATITVTPGNSATYGITVTENDCVGTTQIAVTVNTPPSAVVTLNADVCNGPGGPATLDFSALVIGGDQGGVWTDLQNSGATGTFPTLDFTGVAEGNYLFRYTTQSATAPCQEAIYDVTVQVVFCDCPSVATSAAGPLCNTGGSLNLNTLQQTSEPGTWSIVAAPSGSNPAIITNSIFNATNADAGLYEIRFTLVNTPPAGCPAFSTQFIQVDDAVFAGQPEPAVHFCVGSNDVVSLFDLLQGEDLGGQWTEISAVPSTSGAFQAAAGSFALSGQLPATYRFRYLLSTGGVCPASEAVVSIVIEPSPIANAGADMALDCIITSVTLNGANSSSGPHISYLWSTTDGNITAGINTATPSANAGGVYQLTVTNITYGCSATDEVTVTADNIPPQSAVVSIQNPRCHNETNGAVSVVSVSGGSGPFLYSFNAQPFVASPNFSSLGAGVYPLIVEDANGCRWETSIELENPPAISVDAGPNVTIFYGDSTRLDAEITPASGNYVIKWTPSDSLSCTSCPQPLAGPDSTVTYHVLVTDENGCTATDEVTVFIKFKPDVYIPNSFSPNGDNINDIFMIYAGDRIDKILELEIYSRWGESVFYVANFLPNDPQYGWDGMFRGKPAVLDVYAYFAIILYKDGKQKLFKGDMQVVK